MCGPWGATSPCCIVSLSRYSSSSRWAWCPNCALWLFGSTFHSWPMILVISRMVRPGFSACTFSRRVWQKSRKLDGGRLSRLGSRCFRTFFGGLSCCTAAMYRARSTSACCLYCDLISSPAPFHISASFRCDSPKPSSRNAIDSGSVPEVSFFRMSCAAQHKRQHDTTKRDVSQAKRARPRTPNPRTPIR